MTPYAELLYFIASVLFILGIRGLTSAETARRGVIYAEIGMAFAVAGTLINPEIHTYRWILVTAGIGSAIGIAMAALIPMTKMPERIALSHAFGGLAAALVGVSEYSIYQAGIHVDHLGHAVQLSHGTMGALGFEVLFGGLTFTGSLIAFGKLQGFIPGRNITYPYQNQSNIGIFATAVLLLVLLTVWPSLQILFYLMFLVALVLGVLFVIPIGGADMPVVISLLNSYAGLAASATGFALDNNVLIIAGALDGASGFILSIVMSRAMNRSFSNVLFGAFGQGDGSAAAVMGKDAAPVREASVGDAAMLLSSGTKVIVCPGYGMAVAQAQHAVQKMAELLERDGIEVKYAIHPVAGRMPGHMNVLLAEANVPYDSLKELEEINDEFAEADVALVVGANDVVNPAAKTNTNSPIYGMPVLNADLAKSCIVLKRSMNPGFAGIENELFTMPNTVLVFGDAKDTIEKIVEALS
ncbi:MAG TPA: NAD(P)(+) transhydrogenase (Re/Si-specific) subunit beta [Candidatus Limnocylindrales bacterium]|nr:NAD(P)(+) transhydrogenase (Re/Si-specific) subunit beta [Candidatus Limnocylindrales bacterium]